MKIAIVAPSPVPFAVGGAENLCRGLYEYINQNTVHQADLIKLPSREHSFWDLIDSYRTFAFLDLNHFDLVLTSKYPAWMLNHPRHVCYMLHRLRGLYDHYHLTHQPTAYRSKLPIILKLQSFMNRHQEQREALAEFFGLLDDLRHSPDLPPDGLAFPGPFIREIVHFFDGIGLARTHIHRYAAISGTVARRKEYFPTDAPVQVVYPPSSLKGLQSGRSDYLFTASRFDAVKRVALLIEAMKLLPHDISLKIAGTGPEQERLKAIASGDPRITFLGFVPDHQLADLYADALAVLFVPFDEDYGLITIEGMMCQKPVITCSDSGGPNEFVRDGTTGFSVQPSPAAIAEKISYLCQHPEEARRMGQAGCATVESITWESTVAGLLGEPVRKPVAIHSRRRPKITVASTFPIYPPLFGGQFRIYHLYRNITRHFDVNVVTLSYANDTAFDKEIAPGLREIRVPKSPRHQRRELDLEEAVEISVSDVSIPRLYHLTPDYLAALKRSTAESHLVVACHPYLLPAIMEVSRLPLIYEAQDVEAILKQQVLPDNATGQALLDDVRKVEADCCRLSRLIMVCTISDAESFADLYGVPLNRVIEVPNGVDLEAVHFTGADSRKKGKQEARLGDSFIAVFMGSGHPPNRVAADSVLALAGVLPDVRFLIMGDVCVTLGKKVIPKNIGLMGVVDDETKLAVLSLADVALNPMTQGSGTNLKMLDYMAAGVPVVSTSVGARGLGIEHGKHGVICAIEDFPEAIRDLRDNSADAAGWTAASRALVKERFDWRLIGRKLEEELESLLDVTTETGKAALA